MKLDIPVPIDRLALFKNKLGLEDREMEGLNPHRGIFSGRGKEFAEHFHRFFSEIPETRIILEYEKHQDRLLKHIWPNGLSPFSQRH